MLTFRHAGDLGDLVYGMPVMRALGGGCLCIEAATYTRQKLTRNNWCGIDKLLLQQPYVQDVREWQYGEPTSYNLNDFRAALFRALREGHGKDKHLGHWMCEAHGLSHSIMDEAWLRIEVPILTGKRVVFSRSGAGRGGRNVYHNPYFPWAKVYAKYGDDAVFVGTSEEYEVFRAMCGDRVPHQKTEDLFEAARVIAGCQLFVGNQSCPHAIAEAMKKKIVLEVWPDGPNVLAFRPGVVHGWGIDTNLPDL